MYTFRLCKDNELLKMYSCYCININVHLQFASGPMYWIEILNITMSHIQHHSLSVYLIGQPNDNNNIMNRELYPGKVVRLVPKIMCNSMIIYNGAC